MNAQKGFTLIELMIVIAIIGILAAIALPAYQDYTKRARAAEGLSLAGGAKTAVSEFYSSNNQFPSNNAAAGLAAAANINGNSVSQVNVDTGRITVTYNDKVGANSTIVLSPTVTSGGLTWNCKGGNLASSLRPSECR